MESDGKYTSSEERVKWLLFILMHPSRCQSDRHLSWHSASRVRGSSVGSRNSHCRKKYLHQETSCDAVWKLRGTYENMASVSDSRSRERRVNDHYRLGPVSRVGVSASDIWGSWKIAKLLKPSAVVSFHPRAVNVQPCLMRTG